MRVSKAVCLILLQSLLACGGAEKDPNYIPALALECPGGSFTDCTSGGKKAYAGLSDDLTINCETTLKGLDGSQRSLSFLLTAEADASVSGPYLTASIFTWKNSSGGRESSLDAGTYLACVFIDGNSNGVLDSGEPLSSAHLTPGETRVRVTSWVSAQ